MGFEKLRKAGLLPGQWKDSQRVDPSASKGDARARETLAALTRKESVADRFDLGRELGRGGMGRVVEAYDRELDRSVAMKIIRSSGSSQQDAKLSRRFLEEARVTARIEHPAIPPIYEIGFDANGEFFYTMRLIDGRNLARVFELSHGSGPKWSRT